VTSQPVTIRLQDLTLGYDRHPAVHHVSGVIAPGALIAVVGPNGAGKSTLLKGIAGELKPLGGRVSIEGQRRPRIAYVPQKDGIDLSYPIAVFDLVAMGLWARAGLFGGFRRVDESAVSAALARVGLTGFERRAIGTLSGGQLQRALFARVLLQDSPVILLDEPFSAIDNATVEDLMVLVRGWSAEGRTVLAVLHDLALVRAHFPESLLIARELVAWGPTRDVLTPARIAAARAMREAFDDTAPLCAIDEGAAAGHGHTHHHGHAQDHTHGHGHAHDHHGHHHHGHDHHHRPHAADAPPRPSGRA
jgi:zinc/manganese transport system ATP-binding protein